MKTTAENEKTSIIGIIIRLILSILGLLIVVFFIDMLNLTILGVILSLLIYILFVFNQFRIMKRKPLKRFLYFVLMVALLTLSIISLGVKPSTIPALNYKANKTEVLHLDNGDIQGVIDDKGEVEIYTGIPYAKPPIGELRWKEPVDVDNWEGVKDCSNYAPKAMQAKSNVFISSVEDIYLEKNWNIHLLPTKDQEMSEDCLYLNVYKPKNATSNTPVFVFFHGGSLTSGTTAFSDYNGVEYARNGVIFVQVAYRLGVFGYFALEELKEESPNNTTGNYGLLDQIKALEWVNKNIIKFNGDKDNVTIGGESAGSSSVSALCASPLAKGYFKKAIGESSSTVLKNPPHTFRTLEDAYKMGENIKKEFNVSTLEELRKLDAETLIQTQYKNSSMTVDGYALPKTPYEIYSEGGQNEEILLNGCNLNEADCFLIPQYLFSFQALPNLNNYKERLQDVFKDETDNLLSIYDGKINTDDDAYKAFMEIISTYWFVYPHESWSNMAYNNGVKVYRYLFTKENGYLSTWHSGEMIYAYKNIESSPRRYRYDDTDIALSNKMSSYFINFIKTDDPNGTGLVEWTEWTPTNDKVFEFGTNTSMIDDPFNHLYDFLKDFDSR